jgi:hypothetical protein
MSELSPNDGYLRIASNSNVCLGAVVEKKLCNASMAFASCPVQCRFSLMIGFVNVLASPTSLLMILN